MLDGVVLLDGVGLVNRFGFGGGLWWVHLAVFRPDLFLHRRGIVFRLQYTCKIYFFLSFVFLHDFSYYLVLGVFYGVFTLRVFVCHDERSGGLFVHIRTMVESFGAYFDR